MRGSRRVRLIFVLLLLTAFTLTALDYNTAKTGPLAAMRRGIDTVFGPVQRVVGDAASTVGDALGGLPRLSEYQSDNKKLTQENERLKGIIASMSGLQCQVDQLNGLMGLVNYEGYLKQMVTAHVVTLGPASGFEWTATIDAGSKDGVKPSMTVIAYQGLLGRTVDVGAHTAKVLLIADPDFRVVGTISGQSALGRAVGHGSQPMTYSVASNRSKVKKGDVLVTTGSDTYVPGIPIGTVTSVTPDPNAISRSATIAPFVDVSAIDLVGVITQPDRGPRTPLRPLGVGPSPTSTPCPSALNHGPVPTPSPTPTVTPSASSTPRGTGSPSPSASRSSSRSTRSPSPSVSATASRSSSPRTTATRSASPSASSSP